MKNLQLFSLLLLLSPTLFAQVEFAPAGAEWYHLSTSGYTSEQFSYSGFTYSQYTGDTVFDGLTCKKICTRLYRHETAFPASCGQDATERYLYQKADSIFEFYPVPIPRSRFLFRNNYAVGDVVFQSDAYELSVSGIDTLEFNGRQVRRFLIGDAPQGAAYTYDLFGPENGLFSYDPWDIVVDEGTTKLRCYQDAAFPRANVRSEACDAVLQPAKPHFEVRFIPNPSQTEMILYLDALPNENLTLTILNADGRFILEERVTYSWKRFPVAHLSPGVYICVFRDGQSTFHQKFIKN